MPTKNEPLYESHPLPTGNPSGVVLRKLRPYSVAKAGPWLVQGNSANYSPVLCKLITEAGGGLLTAYQSDVIYDIDDLRAAIGAGTPYCKVLLFEENGVRTHSCGYDENGRPYALLSASYAKADPRTFALRTWLLRYTPNPPAYDAEVTLQRMDFTDDTLEPRLPGDKLKRLIGDAAMANAILEGRKTAVLTILKTQPEIDAERMWHWKGCQWLDGDIGIPTPETHDAAAHLPGDFLYLCEPWQFNGDNSGSFQTNPGLTNEPGWRSPSEMPKTLARIFLRVTKESIRKLGDLGTEEATMLGFSSIQEMQRAVLGLYPACTKETWFAMTEFQRISREKALGEG